MTSKKKQKEGLRQKKVFRPKTKFQRFFSSQNLVISKKKKKKKKRLRQNSECRNPKFKRFFRPKLGCLKLCNTHHSLRFGGPLKIFFRIQLPDKKCFLRFVSPEIRISRIRNFTLYNPIRWCLLSNHECDCCIYGKHSLWCSK